MVALSISPDLKTTIPAVVVGWITASVRNSQHDEALWREIEVAATRFRGVNMDEARKSPPIKALRDAYRSLGNDPTRYRVAQTRLWCDESRRGRTCTGAFAGFKGSRAFGNRSQKVISANCGVLLLGFGVKIVYDAAIAMMRHA